MAMTPKQWSLSALAVEFRMDRRTIAGRLKDTLPDKTKGRTKTWLMSDAAPAVFSAPASGEGKPLDITRETARLKKAQADKTELEVEVLKGTLISGEVVAKIWADFVGACRAKMIAIPSTASTRIVGLDVPETGKELRELIHQALEELKDHEPTDYQPGGGAAPDTPSGKKDSATTKPNNKRVGGRKKVSKQRGKRGTGKVANK